MSRDGRQIRVHHWCIAAFGDGHAKSPEQRALRMVEEAIEAAQACGCNPEQLHRLLDHVYSKPVGDLRQELGSVGITLLALAAAVGISAEDAERDERERIKCLPLEHFAARNKAKIEAGFGVLSTNGEAK